MFWPSVHINNMSYRGNLVAADIFESVCNAISDGENVPECDEVLGNVR